MSTAYQDLAHRFNEFLSSVLADLADDDPATRVSAARLMAAWVGGLEHQVVLDAQASGMSWARIGDVYGVSRQAAHRRFSDETVVPADFFDRLLEDADDDLEAVPYLAKAAERVHRAASA